jgi:hypothetical protein
LKASNSVYLRNIRIRIFGRAIFGRLVREVARAVSTSCMRVSIVVRAGSREVRALVLDDLLKYIVQDGFGIIRIFDVLGDSKDVSTLADVVFDVVFIALVRELSHFNSKRRIWLGYYGLLTFRRRTARPSRRGRGREEASL